MSNKKNSVNARLAQHQHQREQALGGPEGVKAAGTRSAVMLLEAERIKAGKVHRRLRTGVITVLRRRFPAAVQLAEQQAGSRMSHWSDAALFGWMETSLAGLESALPASIQSGELPGLLEPAGPQSAFTVVVDVALTKKQKNALQAPTSQGPKDLHKKSTSNPRALSDIQRVTLDAIAARPEPTFISDLVAATGRIAAVAAWREEQGTGQDRQFGFVSAKPRYRLRGALILPRVLDEAYQSTSWGEICARYRGSKLFEIGVALSSFDDEVEVLELGEFGASFVSHSVGVMIVWDTENSEALPEILRMLARVSIHGCTKLLALGSTVAAGEALPKLFRHVPNLALQIATSTVWAFSDDSSTLTDELSP